MSYLTHTHPSTRGINTREQVLGHQNFYLCITPQVRSNQKLKQETKFHRLCEGASSAQQARRSPPAACIPPACLFGGAAEGQPGSPLRQALTQDSGLRTRSLVQGFERRLPQLSKLSMNSTQVSTDLKLELSPFFVR